MRGLLMKDYLTIRKKYGARRLVIDLAIATALMVALQGTGAVYISLLLIPLEATSMVISLVPDGRRRETLPLWHRDSRRRRFPAAVCVSSFSGAFSNSL